MRSNPEFFFFWKIRPNGRKNLSMKQYHNRHTVAKPQITLCCAANLLTNPITVCQTFLLHRSVEKFAFVFFFSFHLLKFLLDICIHKQRNVFKVQSVSDAMAGAFSFSQGYISVEKKVNDFLGGRILFLNNINIKKINKEACL